MSLSLLGNNNFTAASGTYATIEALLEASFSMRSLSYQRKVGDWLFPEHLVGNFMSTPNTAYIVMSARLGDKSVVCNNEFYRVNPRLLLKKETIYIPYIASYRPQL
jgi:hypothetical protein